MATRCERCFEKIQPRARVCPHCGADRSEAMVAASLKARSRRRRWWLAGVAGLFVLWFSLDILPDAIAYADGVRDGTLPLECQNPASPCFPGNS